MSDTERIHATASRRCDIAPDTSKFDEQTGWQPKTVLESAPFCLTTAVQLWRESAIDGKRLHVGHRRGDPCWR